MPLGRDSKTKQLLPTANPKQPQQSLSLFLISHTKSKCATSKVVYGSVQVGCCFSFPSSDYYGLRSCAVWKAQIPRSGNAIHNFMWRLQAAVGDLLRATASGAKPVLHATRLNMPEADPAHLQLRAHCSSTWARDGSQYSVRGNAQDRSFRWSGSLVILVFRLDRSVVQLGRN